MEQYEAFNRVYDATRDALLRWLIPRVRSEKYVFGIAKKELARFYRHKALVQETEAPIPEQMPAEGPEPEDIVLDREREREIWALIKAEPLLSYQAFTLYYGFSVPTSDIAKQLGLSEDAVRKRLSRTRARLRALLSAQGEEVPERERKGD